MNELSTILTAIRQNINTTTLLISGFTFACGLMMRGFTKEWFDERARVAKHKRNVARKVFDICVEASTGNFRVRPRNMEHVNAVLTSLEGVDEEMGKQMTEFVSAWGTFALERSRGDLSPDDVKFAKGELDRAEEKRKILIKWANKLNAGN